MTDFIAYESDFSFCERKLQSRALKSDKQIKMIQKHFKKGLYLSVRRCETLSSVDSNQRVLLYRDVELEEAWLLHAQLRAPEHPRWDALSRPLPYVHLSAIDGVVLLMEHASPP